MRDAGCRPHQGHGRPVQNRSTGHLEIGGPLGQSSHGGQRVKALRVRTLPSILWAMKSALVGDLGIDFDGATRQDFARVEVGWVDLNHHAGHEAAD